MKIKKRVYEILEVALPGDRFSYFFDIFIITLIFLNVSAVILGTIQSFSFHFSKFLRLFEIISVGIFTLEYILRIWSSPENLKYEKPFVGRLKYIITPLAMVDLMSVLPFFLPMIFPLRLMRLFRLFKMSRYSETLRLFGRVVKAKKEKLLIALFAVFILFTILSSLLFYIEFEAQPEAFSSIPAAMKWAVITSATLGYGDVYPLTTWGKFLGSIISVLGIGLLALLAGFLSSGFIEEIRKKT